jgi:hypothetical protein
MILVTEEREREFVANCKNADFCGQDCFGNFAALPYRYKEQKTAECSRRQEKL